MVDIAKTQAIAVHSFHSDTGGEQFAESTLPVSSSLPRA